MKTLTYEVDKLLPKKVQISLKDELMVSEDIDTEVDRAAHTFGYYAVLSEKADTRLQRLQLSFENWQALTSSRKNSEMDENKEKRYTVEQMKAYIKSHPKYMAYRLKIIQLEEHKRVLKNIVKAFEIKSNMVQTKSANRRREA